MPVLHRYTNLAATIHLLKTKGITLLNPATWDDRNDAYFMAEYKRYKKAKTILALCFTKQNETYHHWRVFSHGSDGVRIDFDMDKIVSMFKAKVGVKQGPVRYRMVREIEKLKSIDVEKLPFLKRSPYQDEKEYRVIFASKSVTAEFKDYPIEMGWIRRITLSPWMSTSLAASVKENLRAMDGCSELSIARSTLVNNEVWKNATTRVFV